MAPKLNSTSPVSAPDDSQAESDNAHSLAAAKWLTGGFSALLLIGLALLVFNLLPNLQQTQALSVDSDAQRLDQQMLNISDRLQCPVCAGQSVAYSNSQLATEMRRQVMEQLEAGASEEAIMQYFVDRYGVSVLREPPKSGLHLWLWFTPGVALVIGGVGLVWTIRNMAQTQRQTAEQRDAETSADVINDPLDADIQELLIQYDEELLA